MLQSLTNKTIDSQKKKVGSGLMKVECVKPGWVSITVKHGHYYSSCKGQIADVAESHLRICKNVSVLLADMQLA